jgi:hypothetical protein
MKKQMNTCYFPFWAINISFLLLAAGLRIATPAHRMALLYAWIRTGTRPKRPRSKTRLLGHIDMAGKITCRRCNTDKDVGLFGTWMSFVARGRPRSACRPAWNAHRPRHTTWRNIYILALRARSLFRWCPSVHPRSSACITSTGAVRAVPDASFHPASADAECKDPRWKRSTTSKPCLIGLVWLVDWRRSTHPAQVDAELKGHSMYRSTASRSSLCGPVQAAATGAAWIHPALTDVGEREPGCVLRAFPSTKLLGPVVIASVRNTIHRAPMDAERKGRANRRPIMLRICRSGPVSLA